MHELKQLKPATYRSIWISDVHLGFKGCRADFLLDFLNSTESEFLYLVGDIIDVWNMKKGLFWPQAHTEVIRTILGKAKQGTKVIYIPGNHDEVARDYHGMMFGNVIVKKQEIHATADGKHLLVTHGDEFDSAVKCNKVVAKVGDFLYDWLLIINRAFNHLRRKLGFSYWSLATYVKSKVKNAVHYIHCFEEAVLHEARRQNVNGLICGHIHQAALREMNGVLYCNTGDWVENCTSLVEQHDGSLELIRWPEKIRERSSVSNIADKVRSRAA
jgi:UDP-2,3-diacylglucosamine pyrophosphatase LpxH